MNKVITNANTSLKTEAGNRDSKLIRPSQIGSIIKRNRTGFLYKLGERLQNTLSKPAESEEACAEAMRLSERRALLQELEETLAELRYARSCFENAKEPEIIEACVYSIKSAESRYSYLLRKAKESGVYQNRGIR